MVCTTLEENNIYLKTYTFVELHGLSWRCVDQRKFLDLGNGKMLRILEKSLLKSGKRQYIEE